MGDARRQHGFVLLMTLILLALAAVALAQVARSSFQQAIFAQQRQQTLQRRWAFRSCENILLPKFEYAMTHPGDNAHKRKSAQARFVISPNVATVRKTIILGNEHVELIFSDEQAKLNVNALLKHTDRATTDVQVRQLLERYGDNNMLAIHPIDTFDEHLHRSDYPWPPLASFAQVFADASPAQLVGSANHPGPAMVLTLWGSGKVNYHRASQSVLTAALAPQLDSDQVRRLMLIRQRHPKLTVVDALSRLHLLNRQRHQADKRLTDGSWCFSLWVIVGDKQRRWYQLVVHNAQRHDWLALKRFSW